MRRVAANNFLRMAQKLAFRKQLSSFRLCNKIIKPRHEISNNEVCATSKNSDQPVHTPSLIGAFASHLNIL